MRFFALAAVLAASVAAQDSVNIATLTSTRTVMRVVTETHINAVTAATGMVTASRNATSATFTSARPTVTAANAAGRNAIDFAAVAAVIGGAAVAVAL